MFCGRKPKLKGARFERRVKKWLESQGYTTFRVAGSLGLVDLVVIKDGVVWLVQVKAYDPNYVRKFDPKPLTKLAKACGALPLLVKRVGKRKIGVVEL